MPCAWLRPSCRFPHDLLGDCKMKTKEEINEMPAAELREQVMLTKQELFSLNLMKGGGLERPHRIPQLRKQIARLETRLATLRQQAEATPAATN